MLKATIAGALFVGSVSLAAAMPTAPASTGTSMPIVKAAVVVKKTVIRRPPVRRAVRHTTTVIRR